MTARPAAPAAPARTPAIAAATAAFAEAVRVAPFEVVRKAAYTALVAGFEAGQARAVGDSPPAGLRAFVLAIAPARRTGAE